jgi:hypothetical protein
MKKLLAVVTSLFCLSLYAQVSLTREQASLAGPCFPSLGDTGFFTVPAFTGDPNTLYGVELKGCEFFMEEDYGFENLTDTYIGFVTTNRYIAHAIAIPTAPPFYVLTQPSQAFTGISTEIFPFDGLLDSEGFSTEDFSSLVPSGPSGYWGGLSVGPSGSPTNPQIASYEVLNLWNYNIMGKAFWLGDRKGLVTLEYKPWGTYSYVRATGTLPSEHWARWVDHIYGTIRKIDSIVYHIDTDDDGVADYEQEILM